MHRKAARITEDGWPKGQHLGLGGAALFVWERETQELLWVRQRGKDEGLQKKVGTAHHTKSETRFLF